MYNVGEKKKLGTNCVVTKIVQMRSSKRFKLECFKRSFKEESETRSITVSASIAGENERGRS